MFAWGCAGDVASPYTLGHYARPNRAAIQPANPATFPPLYSPLAIDSATCDTHFIFATFIQYFIFFWSNICCCLFPRLNWLVLLPTQVYSCLNAAYLHCILISLISTYFYFYIGHKFFFSLHAFFVCILALTLQGCH